MKKILLFTSHKNKLVYVVLLKAGSRTMHRVMFALAGVPKTKDKPWGENIKKRSQELAEHGLVKEKYGLEEAKEYQRQHSDYTWIAITRNPYERALSAYSNKVNRAIRYSHRRIYFLSKLKTLIGHPKKWWSAERSRETIKQHISFEDFLVSLQKIGTDVDPHLSTQFTSLGSAEIRLDKIYDLDDLSNGLKELQEIVGFTGMDLSELATGPIPNQTGAGKNQRDLLTPKAKAIIQEIYANDFKFFHYST